MLWISTPCASLNKEIGPGMSDIESWGSNNDIAPKKLSYFLNYHTKHTTLQYMQGNCSY